MGGIMMEFCDEKIPIIFVNPHAGYCSLDQWLFPIILQVVSCSSFLAPIDMKVLSSL